MTLSPVGAGGGPAADADLGPDPEPEPALTGAWRLDLDGDLEWWSQEMYAVFDMDPRPTPPSLREVAERLSPETACRIRGWRARTLQTGEALSDRFWVRHRDGSRRLVDVHGWGVRAGTARTGFGTCRDVTRAVAERSAHDALAHREATILDAAGEGICGVDPEGRITFANPALLRLMRREGEPVVGRRLHDLVHRDDDDRESHPASECPYLAGDRRPSGATDAGFRRGDGSRIEVGYMRVGLGGDDEDDERGAVVSFRDITARRAAARLLQSSLRQVQTLSAQRGALLGHLAEAEERERMRIAADIHDDLIQALGAVALRLSTTGERARSDEERDLFVDAELEVRGVADRMRRLMFELMPPDDATDLDAAVRTYCSVLFAASPIEAEIVGDVREMPGDRALVAYRLIQEALRNARNHSEGTRVQVSMERRDDEYVLRVSDDGVGMGDPTTPPTHAGLKIVRRRVEAAGGTAQILPGLEGRGSCIELRLPADVGGWP